MRRALSLTVVLVMLAAGVATAVAATGTAAVRVTPKLGGRRTAFTVTFQAPVATTTGPTAGDPVFDRVSYVVYAKLSSGSAPRNCLAARSVSPITGVDATGVTAVLSPRGTAHGWCIGRYTGTVEETLGDQCGPIVAAPVAADSPANDESSAIHVCPQVAGPALVTREVLLGTFSFRVRR
jgi:hypothetical protein